MTTFDQREAAFEAGFVHKEEMAFKAYARRDRELARWAAGLLGKNEAETGEYVIELVRADVDDPRHEAVLIKLKEDLGDMVTEATIREKMVEFLAKARKDLAEGI